MTRPHTARGPVSANSYWNGCRCDGCSDAKATYQRVRRINSRLAARWAHLDALPADEYPDRLLHHSETRALIPVVAAELAAEPELERAA